MCVSGGWSSIINVYFKVSCVTLTSSMGPPDDLENLFGSFIMLVNKLDIFFPLLLFGGESLHMLRWKMFCILYYMVRESNGDSQFPSFMLILYLSFMKVNMFSYVKKEKRQ